MFMGGRPFFFLFSSIICLASSMIVSVVRPKKSNLTRPACSTSFLSYCVIGLPSESSIRGANSAILVGEITTPAACFPMLLITPSNLLDTSISSIVSLSSLSLARLYIATKSGDAGSNFSFGFLGSIPKQALKVVPGFSGIRPATRLT